MSKAFEKIRAGLEDAVAPSTIAQEATVSAVETLIARQHPPRPPRRGRPGYWWRRRWRRKFRPDPGATK